MRLPRAATNIPCSIPRLLRRAVMPGISAGRQNCVSACSPPCTNSNSSKSWAACTKSTRRRRHASRRALPSADRLRRPPTFLFRVCCCAPDSPYIRFMPYIGSMGSRAERLILVVEDDDDVREFAVHVLRDSGYAVIEAVNGGVALVLLEQNLPIDLLFTDIVMSTPPASPAPAVSASTSCTARCLASPIVRGNWQAKSSSSYPPDAGVSAAQRISRPKSRSDLLECLQAAVGPAPCRESSSRPPDRAIRHRTIPGAAFRESFRFDRRASPAERRQPVRAVAQARGKSDASPAPQRQN